MTCPYLILNKPFQNTYANLKCKAISALKRGRPGNQSRDETPTTFTCHGSPAPSNPGTPNCPSKIRKVPATHPDMPLNSLRTDRKDHMPDISSTLRKGLSAKLAIAMDSKTALRNMIMKLKSKNESYAKRLRKALRLSENKTFQSALNKFTHLAALYTVMQFREINKKKMGRRFNESEKIMALSLYKRSPKAYRWLQKNLCTSFTSNFMQINSNNQLKAWNQCKYI
ncbi:hypothetical protein ACJJTC_019247 [Scirpophaga incertulas]